MRQENNFMAISNYWVRTLMENLTSGKDYIEIVMHLLTPPIALFFQMELGNITACTLHIRKEMIYKSNL